MSSHIEIDMGDIDPRDTAAIRAALADVSADDVSKSSPITAGVPEAGVDPAGIVRVEGNDGEWTKTSERALLRALRSVDAVDSAEVVAGGYESGGK